MATLCRCCVVSGASCKRKFAAGDCVPLHYAAALGSMPQVSLGWLGLQAGLWLPSSPLCERFDGADTEAQSLISSLLLCGSTVLQAKRHSQSSTYLQLFTRRPGTRFQFASLRQSVEHHPAKRRRPWVPRQSRVSGQAAPSYARYMILYRATTPRKTSTPPPPPSTSTS